MILRSHIRRVCFVLSILIVWQSARGGELVIEPHLVHLRIDGPREWSDFPEQPASSQLTISFATTGNKSERTLIFRQQDVKQRWNVSINNNELGQLRVDENDMVVYFAVPPQSLVDGDNELLIKQDTRRREVPDDIRVGEIVLDDRPVQDVLSEFKLDVVVVDDETNDNTPARITILNQAGALQTPGLQSSDYLAVRPGLVFTSTGQARIPLPAGTYTIFAGRGFEFSLDSQTVTGNAGEQQSMRLHIGRVVPTEGYVACDTHVHTLTHSGHGDATVNERMVTLAAEGIELPIATDHNVHIDHHPYAVDRGVRQYFTPVIGNEVTTPVGHFNIFPVERGADPPEHQLRDWQAILDGIYDVPGVRVAILNHARDLHGGTTPFGPKLFNDVVGDNIHDWPMRFNSMEVVNSGATQTDVLRLFHDWMSLLNRGYQITPVGSSDSHDVGRHFVGQGRTYIRCPDSNPGQIDINAAVDSFVEGRVMVSYGLLIEMVVDGKYRSGDWAQVSEDQVSVQLRVFGPGWTDVDRVRLYANGRMLREETISRNSSLPQGVLWQANWMLPRPKHDVHLTAIATGPGIDGLYWKTAKAYQPISPAWKSQVVGCSGAIWLDADADGRISSAFDYGQGLLAKSQGNVGALFELLPDYDAAVAAQVASLLTKAGMSLQSADVQTALRNAAPQTRTGFQEYQTAWRANQMAQSTGR